LPEVQAVCDRVQIINGGKTVFADSLSKMSKRNFSNTFNVSFDKSVDIKLLEALPGVENVKALDSIGSQSSYQLSFNQDSMSQSNATEIYKLAVKQAWDLLELSPQNETLEQIFMDLVYSESGQDSETLIDPNAKLDAFEGSTDE